MGEAVLAVWEQSRRKPSKVQELSPQQPEAGGLGAEPPTLENFAFFCKNNLILGLFWWKILLLKRGIEIRYANMIKLVA